MNDLEAGELTIKVEEGPKTLIEWIGISNERDPAKALNPYVDYLLASITNEEVIVDFQKLEYMNSSTVSPIVRLIKLLDKKGIQTLVRYNKSLKWQQTNFRAFDAIARMLKHTVVKGV